MRSASPILKVCLFIFALTLIFMWILRKPSPRDAIVNYSSKQASKSNSPELEAPKEPFIEAEMSHYRQILVSYSTGDFERALSLTEASLANTNTSENFRDWLIRQKPVLLTSVGWTKIKGDACDDAVKIFYKAIALSQVPEAQKGLGYCLRVYKNWPEAASYLALYVLARPSDIEGRLMYADTLESLGRYDDAVIVLEAASTLEVEAELREMAKQRLIAMKAKAKSGVGQKTERSENFFVSYHEETHDVILRQVLDILEGGVSEYTSLLGVAPPANPIEVILYRKEDFYDVVPGGPGWAEGVFDGRMRVPVSTEMLSHVDDRLAVILRHELSHAILSNRSGGRVWPTWFDEGLAQYLACRGRSCEVFRFPAKPSIFSEIQRLNSPFVTLDDVHASSAYLHSLYLVRVLIRLKGESSLDFMLSRLPSAGAVTSDFIAESAGWTSFTEMWNDISQRWQKRFLP